MSDIRWESAENTENTKSGLNHAGMENFKDDPLFHVPRELTQDALDAKNADSEGPVRIVFEELKISKKELEKFEDIIDRFKAIRDTWNDQKTKSHFDKMVKEFQEERDLRVLAVRDYNTIGLSHVIEDDEEQDGGWEALVRSSGYSKKPIGSNGTRGLGKHAPYLASKYSMVFYNTLNISGEIGFQGVAKLATYKMDGKKYRENIYYGNPVDFSPITEESKIPSHFRRNEIGTDKFIIGFNFDESWKKRFIEVIVENFMWAIFEGKLVVTIAGLEISQENLGEVIASIEVPEEREHSVAFEHYSALTKGIKLEEEYKLKNTEELQKVELYLLKNENFNNSVSMNRSSGMKIFDKNNFRRVPARFSGFFVIKGEKLNEFLSETETATHKGWHPDLGKHLDDETLQKNSEIDSIIKKIDKWISKNIHGLAPKLKKDIIDLRGIENILPQVGDQMDPVTNIDNTSAPEKLKSIKFVSHKFKQKEPLSNINSDKPKEPNKADKPDKPDNPNTPDRPGTSTNPKRQAQISTFRFIKDAKQPNKYKLIIVPSKSGEVDLKIQAKGENGKVSEMSIKLFEEIINDQKVEIIPVENTIKKLKLEKDTRHIFSVTIHEAATYALEMKTL